jgi:dipeptidyl aminopeptidase/acylaminoacyl peptidase
LLVASVMAALVLASVVVLLATTKPAGATFPGQNGKIAYVRSDGVTWSSHSELYTINPDGTGQTQLTNNTNTDYEPTWSPDGTKIAYTHLGEGYSNFEIYTIPANGGTPSFLTQGAYPDWQPLPKPQVVPTSKEQCKKGGWQDFKDAEGERLFKNQGDCVSYVATGGKNPPSGPQSL